MLSFALILFKQRAPSRNVIFCVVRRVSIFDNHQITTPFAQTVFNSFVSLVNTSDVKAWREKVKAVA